MASILPIQSNIDNKKPVKPYREAEGAVSTKNNVKPLNADGHLVHDSIVTVPKYFIQDIAYDMKAIKDGFQGNANDHQLGRLNDVGLKMGGIGIATMLAARTSNPLLRIMEYVGLGTFLTSMALYPKLAINLPSRLVHGFDIGKEYIDDQGRKKSVFQDSNYIPFDMYKGDYPGEDLDVIGDRLGIPNDVKNRHDIIKEQMRKIAIQNNTLWMTTAAVVPVMSGLMCYGLERGIVKGIEKYKSAKFDSSNKFNNSSISGLLEKTQQMPLDVSEISDNKLSKKVAQFLENYKNKEIPKAEFENLLKMLTENLDANMSQAVKDDLINILGGAAKGETSYVVGDNISTEIINVIRKNIPANKRVDLERVFLPTEEEVKNIFSKYNTKQLTEDDIKNIKTQFQQLFETKLSKEPSNLSILNAYKHRIIDNISKLVKTTPSHFLNDSNIKDITNFAKVLQEFKTNQAALEKIKLFKVEHVSGSVIANSYAKFENTLMDVLGIKFKELKQIQESDKYAQELFDKKLSELVKDDRKYKKAIEKLTKVMSEMEVKLNGKGEDTSLMRDLISGIENNYNNTAKRISKIGGFSNTVEKLVKEDVSTLSNSLENRKDLFDFLDGTKISKYADLTEGQYWSNEFGEAGRFDYARYQSKGVGSSKNLEISRIVERYQGAKNSFNRILHMFDVYKRSVVESNLDEKAFEIGKKALMSATSSDHTLKLDTVNNSTLYKRVMSTIWDGKLTEQTRSAMSISNELTNGDVLGRLKSYIDRFRDVIANNDIDFTKPHHNLDSGATRKYTKSEKTRMAKFNLVAKNPVDFIKDAAANRYGNQKWLRIASTVFAGVCGTAFLTQFMFGKIRNPENMQRLVQNDANK